MRRMCCIALLVLVPACSPAVDPEAAEAGKFVYERNCAACHTTEIAPSLEGVVGREAGSVEGFSYSAAMRDSELVWNEENLAEYLSDPDAVVPGTNMAFSGLEKSEAEQVVEYLRSQ